MLILDFEGKVPKVSCECSFDNGAGLSCVVGCASVFTLQVAPAGLWRSWHVYQLSSPKLGNHLITGPACKMFSYQEIQMFSYQEIPCSRKNM